MAGHFKDPFRDFMLAAGVPADLYDRFGEESKYRITRHLRSEGDSMGEEGYQIQRRILTRTLQASPHCRIQHLPEPR